MMLDEEILHLASNLLKYNDPEVREQAALLLSSFAVSKNARELFELAFVHLKDLLEDEDLKVR
jgi:hypothetical protein